MPNIRFTKQDDPCFFLFEEPIVISIVKAKSMASKSKTNALKSRNAKEDVAKFSLEDEIDSVTDVFIRRFHKNTRMQKLESFKRQQEMTLR
ncbi:hypothetical protein ZIOFF_009673 [Zingiber officinale]|uniref:Uncharacterized protein n=1 Tax=Zingiber officinale TaxID=94328 RepID=A0A8J5HUC2_ZINOF|nr:hypothetical protein ZIOFF_009673 [Zingiber officinale]